MSYTIGIGVLLDEETCNILRNFELLLFESNQNTSGLSQPPHITVKVPFEVPSMDDIEIAAKYMTDLATKTKKFSIKLQGLGHFSDKVIFAKVMEHSILKELSDIFIGKFSPKAIQEEERKNMIFHSTLAMNLNAKQFNNSQKFLDKKTLDLDVKAIGLGLFLGINDLSYWAVIRQAALL
jgi:2'-5' RNA ligase